VLGKGKEKSPAVYFPVPDLLLLTNRSSETIVVRGREDTIANFEVWRDGMTELRTKPSTQIFHFAIATLTIVSPLPAVPRKLARFKTT
jgi:hypothetical protein